MRWGQVWEPAQRHAAYAIDTRGHKREVPAPAKFSVRTSRLPTTFLAGLRSHTGASRCSQKQTLAELPWIGTTKGSRGIGWAKMRCPRLRATIHNVIVRPSTPLESTLWRWSWI